MNLARIARHLLTGRRQVTTLFPPPVLAAIERAIKQCEATHRGQICFAVEGALDGAPLWRGQSAHERALDVFARLRVWDTEHNNGVLIYLLLADRNVEIVADRGIHVRVGAEGWETICRAMEAEFRRGHFEAGVLFGIRAIGTHLAAHFPGDGAHGNELPDAPVVL